MCMALGPRDICHTKDSPLPSFFTSHPTLSANLFWPLAFCARKLENGKDLKLAILDVAGWRCEKNQPQRLAERQPSRGGKKRWRRSGSGRRQFYFPLCWFKRVEKSSEDLGTQQTKADPPLLGLKVLFLSDTDNIKMIIKDSKGRIDRPLLHWKTTGKNDSCKQIVYYRNGAILCYQERRGIIKIQSLFIFMGWTDVEK